MTALIHFLKKTKQKTKKTKNKNKKKNNNKISENEHGSFVLQLSLWSWMKIRIFQIGVKAQHSKVSVITPDLKKKSLLNIKIQANLCFSFPVWSFFSFFLFLSFFSPPTKLPKQGSLHVMLIKQDVMSMSLTRSTGLNSKLHSIQTQNLLLPHNYHYIKYCKTKCISSFQTVQDFWLCSEST